MKCVRCSRIITLGSCLALTAGLSCDSFTLNISFVRPERAEDTSTQTATMPAGARLVVANENGSTRVSVASDPAATDATIEITRIALADDQAAADALLAAIVVTVTAPTAEDNTLRISAPRPDAATGATGDLQFNLEEDELNVTGVLGSREVAIVRLRITIPAGHEVEVTNENGAIRTVDLDTAGTLAGENTSIRSSDATANLTITTENGAIDVEGHRASLDAQTHNGHVSIEVRALAADQHVTGQTDNGMIELHLPPDLDAALSAETENGFVAFDRDDFDAAGVTVQSTRRVEATLNDGGASVEVQTQNGMIEVDAD